MTRTKKIAFLTTDFLSNKSFSINYYIAILLSEIDKYIDNTEIKIFSHDGSKEKTHSFTEIMSDFQIDSYSKKTVVESLDCYDNDEDRLYELQNFDLIVSTIYFWGDVLEQLKNASCTVKILYWLPSILWHEYIITKQSKWYKYDLALAEQKKSVENSDYIIFNSSSDAFYGARYFGSAIKRQSALYPIPFVKERPKLHQTRTPDKKFIYGFAGRWEYRKGIQYLVESFFRYFTTNKQCELHLMTNLSCEEAIEIVMEPQTTRKFKSLLKADAIKVFPWQKERNNYINFLKSCDVMVLPSMYDPFNIIGYDCISLKIPLILSFFCGIEEIVDECNTLIKVNPLDTEELFLAMRNIKETITCDNDNLVFTVASCSLDDMMKSTFDIYNSLIEKSELIEAVNVV